MVAVIGCKGECKASVINENVFTSEKTQNKLNDEDIDVMPMRTKNSFEAIGEIGLGYKFRNLRIFLFSRYFKGLNNINNNANRFDNPLLTNKYSYIDNSFLLNKYELGASVSYVIKNSVKKIK